MSDYTIGFKKPPQEHCFKPGQSGNPSGTIKGTAKTKTGVIKLWDWPVDRKFKPKTLGDKAARRLMRTAINSKDDRASTDAIKTMLAYKYGPPGKAGEMEHDDGARIELAVQMLVLKFDLPREEAARWIEQAATAALGDGR